MATRPKPTPAAATPTPEPPAAIPPVSAPGPVEAVATGGVSPFAEEAPLMTADEFAQDAKTKRKLPVAGFIAAMRHATPTRRTAADWQRAWDEQLARPVK